jgi:probable HAF family extracellular repeat protein
MTRRFVAALLSLGACSLAAAQPQYTVEVIGGIEPSSPSGLLSLPLGINNNGRVVGYTSTATSPTYILNWKIGSIYPTPPPAGSSLSYGSKVNIRGRIAGASYTLDQGGQVTAARAIRWYGRQPQDLGTLGGSTSVGLGINDYDHIVGYSTVTGEAVTKAFVWQESTGMVPLASPSGATETYAYDISNSDIIVGTAASQASPAKPYMWANGAVTQLPIPTGSRTGGASAVNNAGVSVGTYEIDQFLGTFAAVRWEAGQMFELGNLGGSYPYAKASDINNLGQIVGTSNSANGYTGFLWMNGTMYDLRSLLAPEFGSIEITSAGAINERGQIAAGAIINGRTTAVLLNPIAFAPTPGSMVVLAVAGLAVLRRRR